MDRGSGARGRAGTGTDKGAPWPGRETNAAAALAAAQLPVAGVLHWVTTFGDDSYGGGAIGFGVACMIIVAPPLLMAWGLFQATVQTAPAALLARYALRRAGRGPEWAWYLGCSALVGAVWAVPAAFAFRAEAYPFLALIFAGLGLLPALGAARARVRARRSDRVPGVWGVWWWTALGSGGLCVAILLGTAAAYGTGLLEEYEPPEPSTEQLTGDWRGEEGAVLRLRPGGRAELTRVPAEPEADDDPTDAWTRDFTVCEGAGTWLLDTEGRHDPYLDEGPEERDGVVVRVAGCGEETYWTVGGTEAEPELFVLFGDPDAGDLRILRRR
ncbi:hypothetical protein [Streptomyces minutiscleroticus]|uniref:Uncharacterized protein n=1 Tax=Streptomyces minutiscleroticus TaxID=68238 RepID=A0A918NCS3_9ACTN|nr:hypothetical protein [Streptomyces minutiscleroticus]GGX62920.1 hypothetical protein GCM10010358_16630 [Streptomyces minutiscleroticus]